MTPPSNGHAAAAGMVSEPSRPESGAAGGLVEGFLLLGLGDSWDRRAERDAAGTGAGLAGALLLELVRAGHLRVERGRFEVAGSPEAAGLARAADEVRRLQDQAPAEVVARLARRVPSLLGPWKEALRRRGVLEHREWRMLGVLPRSESRLCDLALRERTEKRLTRLLAGGGTLDAPTILLLALLEASGALERFVPGPTLAFTRKRVHALLSGRDTMDYRIDPSFRALPDTALHAVLRGVREARGAPIG